MKVDKNMSLNILKLILMGLSFQSDRGELCINIQSSKKNKKVTTNYLERFHFGYFHQNHVPFGFIIFMILLL